MSKVLFLTFLVSFFFLLQSQTSNNNNDNKNDDLTKAINKISNIPDIHANKKNITKEDKKWFKYAQINLRTKNQFTIIEPTYFDFTNECLFDDNCELLNQFLLKPCMIWDPINVFTDCLVKMFICEKCGNQINGDNLKTTFFYERTRTVLSFQFGPIELLSATYYCKQCNYLIISHNPQFMEQYLEEWVVDIFNKNVYLTNKCSVTGNLLSILIKYGYKNGIKNFEYDYKANSMDYYNKRISDYISYCDTHDITPNHENINIQSMYGIGGKNHHLFQNIFIHYMEQERMYHEYCIMMLPVENSITIDHTYKTAEKIRDPISGL